MGDSSSGVLVVGDTTVDLYPVEGDAATAGSCFKWHVGGTATNVARWLAKLDTDVALVTNIGTDTPGEVAAQHLDASSIRTDYITRVDGPSPLTLYVPTANGAHWDAWIQGTCYGFTPPDDLGSLVLGYDWLHLEGVTLPEAVNGPAVRELAKTADTNGTAVAFDLNGRPKQWEHPTAYRNALKAILPYCSVVFAGTADLAVGDIEPTPAGLCAVLPTDYSGTAFLTDGASATTGLRLEDGAVIERVSRTPPDVSITSAAGAGDAFAAGVLAGLQRGVADLDKLVAVGNAAGAATVTVLEPFSTAVVDDAREVLDEMSDCASGGD